MRLSRTSEISSRRPDTIKLNKDCAIFGVPESEYGEAIVAAIQAEPGTCLGPEDVKSFIRKNMANFKVPKFVTFHDKLPREDSGKIYKRKLREIYLKT